MNESNPCHDFSAACRRCCEPGPSSANCTTSKPAILHSNPNKQFLLIESQHDISSSMMAHIFACRKVATNYHNASSQRCLSRSSFLYHFYVPLCKVRGSNSTDSVCWGAFARFVFSRSSVYDHNSMQLPLRRFLIFDALQLITCAT